MIGKFVLLCSLIGLSVAQIDNQVRHLILNDANLIETSSGFAMNAPSLLMNNWKTVSINGDNVQIYSPTCQLTSMSKQDLMSSIDQQNLIASAKQSLYAVESGTNQMGGQSFRSGSTRFSMNGNSVSSSVSRNFGMSNFNSDGISITKYDDSNMSMARPAGSWPDGIVRVFLSNDVVTYVYQDGRVLMKPAACLSASEQQLIQQLRLEVQEAKRKFDIKMQQFHQNMRNMQINLQRNLQNMHQNLQNMFQPRPNTFGAGFPFGNTNAYAGGLGAATAYSQAGNGQASAGSGNWPFGQNNSPFYPGFPFGRR